MIELTPEQQRQMQQGGWPPRFRNPATREEFVLIHAEMFDRVRALLEAQDEIPEVEEMYPTVIEAMDPDEGTTRETA
jgi:hypothetical protein